jgi:hypothetical protein
MYHELWIRSTGDLWHLGRAYLNIYETVPGDVAETGFLFLHCDPNEPTGAAHAAYKKVPHLHVRAAPPPFPHAHIALSGGRLDLCLSSVDVLTDTMGWAVAMLKDEVLEPKQAEMDRE